MGGIIEFEPASSYHWGFVMPQGLLESAIEDTGSDPLVVLLKDFTDGRDNPRHALAAQCGEGEDGREGKEAKAIADVLQKVRRLSPDLLHRIPLIDADDAPAVTLLDISRNMKVLVGNALRCIEQDNGHMAPVYTA